MTVLSAHLYQVRAARRMVCAPNGYGLFLDPGMGKTSIALTAVSRLLRSECATAALVVAPLRSAVTTWPGEAAKWDCFRRLRVSVICGTEKQRLAALAAVSDVYTINPENVAWLARHLKSKAARAGFRPDILLVDESTKFKSGSSVRFRALRFLLPLFDRRYILTGTPASQSVGDLWSQIYLLDGGERLGRTLGEFRARYMVATERRGGGHVFTEWKPTPGAELRVFDAIKDLVLRLSARDYLNMPERIDNQILVQLPPPARRVYQEVEKKFYVEIEGAGVEAASAAAVSIKLRQIVGGAVYDDKGVARHVHDAKIDALRDLVEEQSGQPLLVAVAFKHEVERIKAAIPGCEVAKAHDATFERRWNAGEIPVALMHPAGVHSMNLQGGCRAVAWFCLTWSLEDYIQFNMRVERQGQSSPTVVIHHIVAADTVDQRVSDVLKSKDATQQRLFDALKAPLWNPS
jgi:SNF2 family DNA or RNA helicase